jgi:putative ABC transport system permease protein
MSDLPDGPRRAFRLPAARSRVDETVDEEFAFHLRERIDEWMAAGLTREEAEAEARRRFGDVEAYRRQTAEVDARTLRRRGRIELWDVMRRETRQAVRSLLRSPVFAIVAVATLAIGIGATTAVYSILDAVVLRPLPYPEPARLVSVLHPATVPGSGSTRWGLSSAGYFFFEREARTLDALGVYLSGDVTMSGDGAAEVVRAGYITQNVLALLGARPAAGRLLTPDDDRPGAAPVVVLGFDLWQRRFGGDPAIIGRELDLTIGRATVIGVTQRGLHLPRPGPFASSTDLAGFRTDLWVPLLLDPAARPINSHPYAGLGRLAPGVTAADAQRELATLTARLPEEFPSAYARAFMEDYRFEMAVEPLRESLLGSRIPRMLWIILGAVGLVFVIAFANVGNLFLVRAEARGRERAIRTALGAARGRIALHALSESLLVAAAAAGGAVAIAAAGLPVLVSLAPTDMPRMDGVSLTMTAVLVAVGLALASGIAFGLVPVLRRTGGGAVELREGGRGSTASRRQRATRAALVVTQVAIALVLLTGAGLMVRSFAHLRGVQPGLDPSGVFTFRLALPTDGYRTAAEAAAFHRQLQDRIGALPGVTSVGATQTLPLRDMTAGCSVVFRPGAPYASDQEPPCVATPKVTPGFFEALGIPVRGRVPAWSDVDAGQPVAVVSAELADRLWPGQDPIGKGINSNGSQAGAPVYRIVGVVSGVRGGGLDQPATEAVFYPPVGVPDVYWGPMRSVTYVVKTSAATLPLTSAIRQAITEIDGRVALANPSTMDAIVSGSMARVSFILTLLGVAAAVAFLLSAVGLYGVVSYVVSRRRNEIGVRIALGARMPQVAGMVIMQSVRLAIVGSAIGLCGAFAGTRLMRALLFEVSPTDPVIFTAVASAILLIAALASVGPARRAARIPPAEALRAE